MNNNLVKLTKRRVELTLAIAALTDDVNKAPLERKFAVAEEIAFYQGKLHDVEKEIEVIELNEQWAKDACDKPVTIVLKGK